MCIASEINASRKTGLNGLFVRVVRFSHFRPTAIFTHAKVKVCAGGCRSNIVGHTAMYGYTPPPTVADIVIFFPT